MNLSSFPYVLHDLPFFVVGISKVIDTFVCKKPGLEKMVVSTDT
jgi:hypothetical protein